MGNQLFIYFNALFYAEQYSYKLEIDKYSGFARDKKYKRFFDLDRFSFNHLSSCSYLDRLSSKFRIIRIVFIYFKKILGVRFYDFLMMI